MDLNDLDILEVKLVDDVLEVVLGETDYPMKKIIFSDVLFYEHHIATDVLARLMLDSGLQDQLRAEEKKLYVDTPSTATYYQAYKFIDIDDESILIIFAKEYSVEEIN